MHQLSALLRSGTLAMVGPLSFAASLALLSGYLLVGRLAGGEVPGLPARFIRGDVNADGILSQADILAVIRYFYHQNSRQPPCADAADFDDSSTIDITDMVNMASFLYMGGQALPRTPFPEPGEDPTPDGLGCESTANAPGGGAAASSAREERDEVDGQVIDYIEFYSHRVSGFPGQRGIRVPITLSNVEEIDGFTVSVAVDSPKVWLEKIDLPRAMPGRNKPEFSPAYTERMEEGYLARSMFMDYLPPFEGRRIPRGKGATVAYLVFGLSAAAEVGERYRVHVMDIPPESALRPTPINEISVDGRSIRPALDRRGLEIVVARESELFVRGDLNRDRALNITDVILILRFLFIGETLACLDPADVDDNGRVNISDVVILLDYLFNPRLSSASLILPEPFPNPGQDPTPDPFDCK